MLNGVLFLEQFEGAVGHLPPRLADSQAYVDQEWAATFTNRAVSDPLGHRALKVPGPGSVRTEENDS